MPWNMHQICLVNWEHHCSLQKAITSYVSFSYHSFLLVNIFKTVLLMFEHWNGEWYVSTSIYKWFFWITYMIKWKFLDYILKYSVSTLKKVDLVSNVLSCYYTSNYQDTKNIFCGSVWKRMDFKDVSASAYSQDW